MNRFLVKNKFTVTISDIYGSKSFNISQILKKYLIYISLSILMIVVATIITAFYLKSELDILITKKNKLVKEYDQLIHENKNLQSNIGTKNSELNALSGKLDGIEELLGIKSTDSISTNERIDIAGLSTFKKKHILQTIPNGYPLEYKGVTSSYGYRKHPTTGEKDFHRALDLRGKVGTDVYTTADGVVEYTGYHKKSGYGNLVIIDHGFGFKTIYGHLKKSKVKTGDSVSKGDVIAHSGNSGRSSGPHLHYEIKFVNRSLNPNNFVKWDISNFDQIFEKEKKVKWASLLKMIENQISRMEKQLLLPGPEYAELLR
jgi:murein DD-endopeptidase MepM/ murein hydrolase activator NlpD